MKKRLKKKLGSKYNLLRYVQRQMYKRKGGGPKYITYEVIAMGEEDKSAFTEGYGLDFYWFVKVYYEPVWKDYVVKIYPCNRKGRINERNSYVRIVSFKKKEEIMAVFEKIVDDMKNDNFMKEFYTCYYEDFLFY